ncbi:helix-turn-helix transcriptional regulator [Rhizobium sp. S152]|uniref:helix-turn-helix domain-containing protein n=1 Tax=Rhizobium sp. S152 TaxID=3055038 RepID=UPI0025A9B23B|nr:helix-turn-helix transcriptional regulator [Rhizobium sp. S152]MDM9628565.1 helix-turn-helix transcriptional regulator [Rhizobium sp. S152]
MKPTLTPALVRAARGLLGWSQPDLAAKSGVAVRTISRLESSDDAASSKVSSALHSAFSNSGIRFVAKYDDGGNLESYGVMRVSGSDTASEP